MKQFILATANGTDISTVANKLGIVGADGSDFFQLSCGNGPAVMPDHFILYRKNLRWTKTEYAAAVNFSSTFTVTVDSAFKYNEVFVVIAKRGAVFNQRNVWTASGHGKSAADVAKSLVENINKATATHGITATVSTAAVTLTNVTEPTTDYDITVKYERLGKANDEYAHDMGDIAVTTTHGKPAVADAAYVKELAHKCMGDKGAAYTYVEAYLDTYHFYNKDGNAATAASYTIYNIKFYNPRYDHNIDEPLFQTLHVAIPTTASAVATALEAALNGVDVNNEQTEDKAPATA